MANKIDPNEENSSRRLPFGNRTEWKRLAFHGGKTYARKKNGKLLQLKKNYTETRAAGATALHESKDSREKSIMSGR